MSSYLEIQRIKQRLSKSIIDRNVFRRQFLAKQQPDVGDIEPSEESLPEGVVPVYWRDDQAASYDPRIRWTMGPRGQYYYDSREGVRTFDEEIPEGFLSEREFNQSVDLVVRNTYMDEATVRESFRTPDSSLSKIRNAALEGDTDTIRRYEDNTTSLPYHVNANTIVNLFTDIRGSVLDGLEQQNIFTTESVARRIQQDDTNALVANLSEQDAEDQKVQEAQERVQSYYNQLIEEFEDDEVNLRNLKDGVVDEWKQRNAALDNPFHLDNFLKVNFEHRVTEEEYESLSEWGKESLNMYDSENAYRANIGLFDSSDTKVFVLDAGDAVYPESYQEIGVETSTVQRAGNPLRTTKRGRTGALNAQTALSKDLVKKAWQLVLNHNKQVVEDYYKERVTKAKAEVAGDVSEYAASTLLSRVNPTRGSSVEADLAGRALKYVTGLDKLAEASDVSVKELSENLGDLPDDVIGKLKNPPRTLSFSKWMQERDKQFQVQLEKAYRVQGKRDASLAPKIERRENFKNRATNVVGHPTPAWKRNHASVIADKYSGIQRMQNLTVPSTAKVWPPNLIEDSEGNEIDGTDTSLYQTGEERGVHRSTLGELIRVWTQWNIHQKQRFSPTIAAKEAGMDFAEGQIKDAYRLMAHSSSTSNEIISTDAEGEIGASIKATLSGEGRPWQISSAGANTKGFPSYPADEVMQGLIAARRTASGTERAELNKAFRSFTKYGQRLKSGTARGTGDKKHGMYVFMEWARRFIEKGGTSASTSPLNPHVTNMYTGFGFTNGRSAHRLNIIHSLITYAPELMPRDETNNIILKEFSNQVAQPEKHDIIIKDNTLHSLQKMLDDLVSKQDTNSDNHHETAAKQEEEWDKLRMETLGMNEEEYLEWLDDINYMLSGTGPSKEKK